MRKSHYWRPTKSTPTPTNLLFFDSETLPESEGENATSELLRLRLGWINCYRLEPDRRTRERWCSYRDAKTFWGVVRERLDPNRPLWVFAHNLAFDLGTVSGWQFLTSKACAWSTAAIDPPIFFMKGTIYGKPVVLCDSFNYFRCSLSSLGSSVGRRKRTMPDFSASDDRWSDYCRNDVEVLSLGIESLLHFWREHQLGPWGPTISTLAFAAYRARFMSHKVLVHCDQRLLELERAAYYGGRVDTPTIGVKHEGPIFECDVNSMYPWACLGILPTRPIEHATRNARLALRRLRHDCCYIADVEVRTKDETYPCRINKRLYYPVGTYRTALADAELRQALAAGHIRRVFSVGVFDAAPIFADYVRFFWELKNRYDREGNEGWRTIAKSLLTNLYGKTGQLSPQWDTLSPKAWKAFEEYRRLPVGTLAPYYKMTFELDDYETELYLERIDDVAKLRCLWGITELNTGRIESRDSVPAIASCVTSRSRVALRRFQDACGRKGFLYSDTDSVWVTEGGRRRLVRSGLLNEGVLGKLACKAEYASLTVHGRKDYEAGETIKLKGVRNPYEPEPDGSYKQLHFPSVIRQIKDNESAGVIVRRVTKKLNRTPDHCHVGRGGWTYPLVFPDDLPE